SRHVEQSINNLAKLGATRPSQNLGLRQVRGDYRPFGIRHIACVALPLALILGTSGFGPHVVLRCLLPTTLAAQQTEITQLFFGPTLSGHPLPPVCSGDYNRF